MMLQLLSRLPLLPAGGGPLVANRLLARGLSALEFSADDTWIREVPSTEVSKDLVLMECGITEAGLDAIGDLTALKTHPDKELAVPARAPVATLEWQGYSRTASDELYHARWGLVRGEQRLAVPLAARVVGYNGDVLRDPDGALGREPGAWVVRLEATREALEAARVGGRLFGEGDYQALVGRREVEAEDGVDGTGARL